MSLPSEAVAATGARHASFFETIRQVILEPRAWFYDLPSRGSTGRALGIAILVRLVADPLAAAAHIAVEAPVQPMAFLVVLVTAPLATLLSVYVPAAFVYLLARSVRERAGFGPIVQCFAYVQVAALWSIVPVVGTIIAIVWSVWLSILGLRTLGRSRPVAWIGTLAGIGAVAAIGLVPKTCFEAYRFPSASMEPALVPGDHFLVDKTAYGWLEHRPPARGDVIVFPFPEKPAQSFAKRVVGLPGDVISLRGITVEINGWKIPSCLAGQARVFAEGVEHPGKLFVEFLDGQAYLVFHDETAGALRDDDTMGPYRVSRGEVFVLGDNRENSHDSRGWWGGRGGGVDADNIKGRVTWIWGSSDANGVAWSRIGTRLDVVPRCPTGSSPETCEGIARCLARRPSRAETTPPLPGTAPL